MADNDPKVPHSGEHLARFAETVRNHGARINVSSAHDMWSSNFGEEVRKGLVAMFDGQARGFMVLNEKIRELEAQNTALQAHNTELLLRARKAEGEWSGSPDPEDPDNAWIDDDTGERIKAG